VTTIIRLDITFATQHLSGCLTRYLLNRAKESIPPGWESIVGLLKKVYKFGLWIFPDLTDNNAHIPLQDQKDPHKKRKDTNNKEDCRNFDIQIREADNFIPMHTDLDFPYNLQREDYRLLMLLVYWSECQMVRHR
jgi:hypothetical protein